MAEPLPLQISQGHSLGPFALGASIHDVLARIKASPRIYPKIHLTFSQAQPLARPVVIALPHNGLRLRFDGVEQRLRLIEVMDFGKVRLLYKNDDISPRSNSTSGNPHDLALVQGPKFRAVYKIFGPTTPGEYIPPADRHNSEYGTYVLSYPGVAFSFPLKAGTLSDGATWSSTVSLMSSSAAGAATAMSVFAGESWQNVRGSIFTAEMSGFLRSPLAPGMKREMVPREVETARIYDRGRVELVRKDAPSFWLVMGETTPQDLITELGPPDSIHRKNDRRVAIHRARKGSSAGHSRRGSSNVDTSTSPRDRRVGFTADEYSEQSSSVADTDDDDDYDDDNFGRRRERTEQVFYNYYSHGFDILISNPTAPSSESPTAPDPTTVSYGPKEGTTLADVLPRVDQNAFIPRNHLTATKIMFHGNIPGSWPFNRHRRIRWTLESVPTDDSTEPLTSETSWPEIQGRLDQVFRSCYASEEEQRAASLPMVVNRGWGREDVSVDSEWGVVGGWEDGGGLSKTGKSSEARDMDQQEKIGGTEVYGFPGLIFEVLKNGAVSSLMVY